MDDATQPNLIRRSNSNSISKPLMAPINLSFPHPPVNSISPLSSLAVDFDLISIKSISYTSLRDLLPSTTVSSPKPNSPSQSGCEEISIKNRLVKHAAWAYLQPMSTTPDASGRNFLHRLWAKLLDSGPVIALRRFFNLHVKRRLHQAFDRLLRALCFRSST